MKIKDIMRGTVNEAGVLKGILSLNDIILLAEPIAKPSELSYRDVMPVLRRFPSAAACPRREWQPLSWHPRLRGCELR